MVLLTQRCGLKSLPVKGQNGPSFPTVRTERDFGRLRKGPSASSPGRLQQVDRLAQTLGVPRVSRSAVLAAVPAGHAVRPEAGRSAALRSQPLGFVIASPAFPPSAGPTSAGPPSTPRRVEKQPGDPEWRSPRPQRGRQEAAGESAGRARLRAGRRGEGRAAGMSRSQYPRGRLKPPRGREAATAAWARVGGANRQGLLAGLLT